MMLCSLLWLWAVLSLAQADILWDIPNISEAQWVVQHKDVEGRVTMPFQGTVGRGLFPMFIELKHNGAKAVEIEISIGQASDTVFRQTLRLAPGEHREYEWEIPIKTDIYYSYGSIMVDGIPAGTISSTLETFSPESFHTAMRSVPRLILSNVPSQKRYPEWFAAADLHNEAHSGAKFLETDRYLPSKHSGYSSIFTVVWFIDHVDIGAKKRLALANWVQDGGHLIVVGDPLRLQAMTEFSGWKEQRFLTEEPISNSITRDAFTAGLSTLNSFQTTDYLEVMTLEGIDLQAHQQWRMGFGLLTSVSQNISMEQAYQLQMNFLQNRSQLYNSEAVSTSDIPTTIQSDFFRGIWNSLTLQKLEKNWSELELAPSWLIVLLSYAFLMLIGPINLFLAFRRSRMLLLISTPLIGLFCVAAVIAINFFLNVQPVRGLSSHRSLFDQRNASVVSTEQRLFFLSRRLKEEPRPTATSALLPVSHEYQTEYILSIDQNEQSYQRYADYRKISAQWGWHQSTHRLKLGFADGRVQNNFEFDIEEIYYADRDGNLWRAKDIPAGQTATLTQLSGPLRLSHWNDEVLSSLYPRWQSLPKRTYLLRASHVGLGVSDEISEKISQRRQIIYGIL